MDKLNNLVLKKGNDKFREELIEYIKSILLCIRNSDRVYVKNSEIFINKLYKPENSVYIHSNKIYIPESIINKILGRMSINELLDLLDTVTYKEYTVDNKCRNRKILERDSYRRVTINTPKDDNSKITIIAFNYLALKFIARDLIEEGVF